MITNAQLKHNSKLQNVRVSYGFDKIFLFANSIFDKSIPEINDEIIDDEGNHFIIKSITPLITGKSELDNYCLLVDVI